MARKQSGDPNFKRYDEAGNLQRQYADYRNESYGANTGRKANYMSSSRGAGDMGNAVTKRGGDLGRVTSGGKSEIKPVGSAFRRESQKAVSSTGERMNKSSNSGTAQTKKRPKNR